MKKIFALSLFAMAAFVSQAWAQSHCCWEGNSYNDNKGYCGPVTPGGPDDKEGTAAYCEANYGTLMNGCSSCDVGTGDKDDAQTCDGYCKWDTGCTSIKTDPGGNYGTATSTCSDAIANCDANGLRYDNATCSGTPIGGVQSCNQWCKWPTGCVEIKPDPSGQYGDPVPDCPTAISNCETNGQIFSSQSACESSSTPTIKFTPASQALIVAPYGRSLHISSARDAMVSLYDMSGAKVYSGRVRAGNSVFSLERVASGSYYAVVQAGSSSKKVPVILK